MEEIPDDTGDRAEDAQYSDTLQLPDLIADHSTTDEDFTESSPDLTLSSTEAESYSSSDMELSPLLSRVARHEHLPSFTLQVKTLDGHTHTFADLPPTITFIALRQRVAQVVTSIALERQRFIHAGRALSGDNLLLVELNLSSATTVHLVDRPVGAPSRQQTPQEPHPPVRARPANAAPTAAPTAVAADAALRVAQNESTLDLPPALLSALPSAAARSLLNRRLRQPRQTDAQFLGRLRNIGTGETITAAQVSRLMQALAPRIAALPTAHAEGEEGAGADQQQQQQQQQQPEIPESSLLILRRSAALVSRLERQLRVEERPPENPQFTAEFCRYLGEHLSVRSMMQLVAGDPSQAHSLHWAAQRFSERHSMPTAAEEDHQVHPAVAALFQVFHSVPVSPHPNAPLLDALEAWRHTVSLSYSAVEVESLVEFCVSEVFPDDVIGARVVELVMRYLDVCQVEGILQLPSEWRAVVARDVRAQAEMSRQPPLSDLYLQGMSRQARKKYRAALEIPGLQLLQTHLREAIRGAGLEDDDAAEAAPPDVSLQKDYIRFIKEQFNKDK